MMTLLAAVVLIGMVLTALYAVEIFSTSYTEAFRIALYVLLLVVLVGVVFLLGPQPFGGTPTTP